MSTSVDQRNKGQPNQVPNGSNKDGVKDEDFDPYMQPHQTGYSAAPMPSPGVSDHYMPNYYSPMSFYLSGPTGVGGEGAWSNGGETPMFSVGNYEYNGMFSGFTYPPFGWEVAGGDYWNAPGQGRKDNRAYGAEEYYRADAVAPVDGYSMNGDLDRENGMNSMESGMNAMNLSGGEKLLDNSNSLDCAQSGDGAGNKAVISGTSQAPKKASWASIASQPARPQPPKIKAMPRPPLMQGKQPHNMDIGTWENKNNSPTSKQQQPPPQMRQSWSAPRNNRQIQPYGPGPGNGAPVPMNMPVNFGLSPIATNNGLSPEARYPVVDKLRSANQYNPKEFNLNPKGTRFFIIKSYSEDDIHRSIKYSIWCSTEHGNKRLDQAHREREGKGPIYLLFSVNGSGHFCGMAQMMSSVDYGAKSGVWAQDKWKGQFEVKWIYVKDVPNSQLRHIRLENNENKPVTNSRDTQEVPPEKGKQILKIVHSYKHTTSIFDDFGHYEKRQEEDQTKQRPPQQMQGQERQERRQRQN